MSEREVILQHLVGQSYTETSSSVYDWLMFWPVVDKYGVIRAITDADGIPEGATLLAWSTKAGRLAETEGNHGFDAVLGD